METIHEDLERFASGLGEIGDLMEGTAEVARDIITTDPDIQCACDPNNEYMRFEHPVLWEHLEARKDQMRLNYYRRKFRFELE